MKDGSTATASLLDFRERLYSCVPRRADDLFELCEAVLTAGPVPSLPHLSLASMHRCSWSSLYAALSRGCIDAQALRDLLAVYTARSSTSKTPKPGPSLPVSTVV